MLLLLWTFQFFPFPKQLRFGRWGRFQGPGSPPQSRAGDRKVICMNKAKVDFGPLPSAQIDDHQPSAMGKQIDALTGFVSLNMFTKEMQPKVAAAIPSLGRVHALRCSAHEYRMIAQGRADFLLTAQLHPWDHLAGALICERAGCHVEMLDGGPYDASRLEGHLLVAPDRQTWNRLKKVFDFLT